MRCLRIVATFLKHIKINDSHYVLDKFEGLNAKVIPDNAISKSFDSVNMFPSIGIYRSMAAVRNLLNSRSDLSQSFKPLKYVQYLTSQRSDGTTQ